MLGVSKGLVQLFSGAKLNVITVERITTNPIVIKALRI